MKRFTGIDTTRGIVMVIMALDHVRDFMHISSMSQDPTNLQTTTALLFFTRWITHLCAPTFVFLAGASAYISFRRKNNLSESMKFLLFRGIWLVLLEFTIINFALWFDIHFRLLLMEVISTIGLSFIVLSFLLWLPSRTIGIIGVILIISGSLIQGIPVPTNTVAAFPFSVLFRPNLMQLTSGHSFYSAYPLVPWLGIMLTGFSFGEVFDLTQEKRRKILLKAGMVILLAFVIIRSINIYGDPSKWASQHSSLFTFFSFLNVSKYPPSLLFTLLFTSITLLLLSITEYNRSTISKVISIYGRVPLFYFIIHLFIIHAIMFLVLIIQGCGIKDFIFGAFKNGRPETGGGVGLAVIYLIWIAVVALLYPVCRRYGEYKAAHPKNKILRFI